MQPHFFERITRHTSTRRKHHHRRRPSPPPRITRIPTSEERLDDGKDEDVLFVIKIRALFFLFFFV